MKNLIRKLKTARSMPPEVLAVTLANLAKRKLRKPYIKLFPVKLSDKQFFKAINHMNIDQLHPFFFNPRDKNKIVETIKKEYPASIPETIKSADEVCNHIFDLLGSGKTKLGKEIDWHLDFKSGFRWDPKEYYLGTGKHVTLDDQSDVKVPWELSRCQHFVTLGKAYWYTGNEKYAKEFVSQIESWISQNPVELGVNWACAMDVAIRAVNWIWGYYFFCKSKTLTKEFKIKFFKSLFLHGRHIINNLEFGQIRGNHYLSDIVGLIYIGLFLPECKDTKKWLNKGLSALKEEMEFQVHPDGVDFEASISYHRLVTELFLSSILLCKINNISIPKELLAKLEKMIDFTMHYTKPDGKCPLIGDADDGRLHILSKNDINDHRYLLSVGAVIFEREDFKSAYPKFNEEAFWLLGIDGLNKLKNLPIGNYKVKSKGFKKGGFYIMRADDLYMIIDCGEIGLAGHGGHGHCDTLSFELFANGKTVIVDPGTYVYTAAPAWRNLFRSTSFHNTIVVDNKEMNRFEEDELFAMKFDAVPKVHKWEVTEDYDIFDGEHSGYERLQNPVTHRRQIYFNKKEGYWIIKDILTGKGKHKFDLYFHFTPMEIKKDWLNIITENGVTIKPLETKGLNLEIQEGWISESYGKKVNAPVVKYSKKVSTPTIFMNVIYPYKEDTGVKSVIEKVKNDLNAIKLGVIK